jgi:hypothetical protein
LIVVVVLRLGARARLWAVLACCPPLKVPMMAPLMVPMSAT